MIAIPTLIESLVTPWALPESAALVVAPRVSAATTNVTAQSAHVERRWIRVLNDTLHVPRSVGAGSVRRWRLDVPSSRRTVSPGRALRWDHGSRSSAGAATNGR